MVHVTLHERFVHIYLPYAKKGQMCEMLIELHYLLSSKNKTTTRESCGRKIFNKISNNYTQLYSTYFVYQRPAKTNL